MIAELLKSEVQDFITSHEHDVPAELMLQASRFPHLPMKEIVEQIQSKKKARLKIPDWYTKDNIIYPPTLSLEQCSSQETALYKRDLISGNVMVDLTGGMGVDSYYLSKGFKKLHYVERQQYLAEIASHNFSQLKTNNVQVHSEDAEEFLKNFKEDYEAIFIDPARRDESSKKVFRLVDCEPNLVELLPKIKSNANILIKAAPLLDIKSAINDLGGISEVHVVAVKGEVKELLFLVRPGRISNDPLISCIDLNKGDKTAFNFTFSEEEGTTAEIGSVKRYLYEPNAAILKGGAFRSFANRNGLIKLHANTHLYTSDDLLSDIQGRVFEVKAQISINKKTIRKLIPDLKANISTRNFPLTVQQIRKKSGLKEGGDQYIFATRDASGAIILLCNKVISI